MSDKSPRLGRVEEEIKKEISSIISLDVKNPDVTGLVSVTKVKVSPDLKTARIYISILNAKNTKESFNALNNSKGFIRSELAKKIYLKYTPEIIFEYDDSMEYGQRIDNLINEIKGES